jgi:hypothetical protein
MERDGSAERVPLERDGLPASHWSATALPSAHILPQRARETIGPAVG